MLLMFWGMSVMAGDACGTGVQPEPRVCDGNYFATWWLAYGALLLAAAVVTPVAILLAPRFRVPRWPWPLLVIALLPIMTVGYFVMISR
jgi:hypothetical protein